MQSHYNDHRRSFGFFLMTLLIFDIFGRRQDILLDSLNSFELVLVKLCNSELKLNKLQLGKMRFYNRE